MGKSWSLDEFRSLPSRIFRKEVVRYSLVVGIIGGTAVNLISQGDAVYIGDELSVFKIILTYICFYCLATYKTIEMG